MTGRTHAVAAFVLATAVTHNYTSDVIFAAIIGGILPDIDTPKSLVSDLIPGIDNIWNCIRNFLSSVKLKLQRSLKINNLEIFKNILKLLTKLFSFLHSLFKHRGTLTHSAITLIILRLIMCKFNNLFMYSLFLGVISHHIMDLLTDQGLNYLYPLVNKNIGAKLITTGSKVESCLYYLIVIIGICFYMKI